jgi:hypothetical protein
VHKGHNLTSYRRPRASNSRSSHKAYPAKRASGPIGRSSFGNGIFHKESFGSVRSCFGIVAHRHTDARPPVLRHVRRRGTHRLADGRAHRARPGLHHLQVHQDRGLASRRVLLLLPARRADRHRLVVDHRQDLPRVGGAHRRHQLVRLRPHRVRRPPGGDLHRGHHRSLRQPGTFPAGNASRESRSRVTNEPPCST